MQFKQKNTVTQNVVPGEYGSSVKIPVLTVDSRGRVTKISVQNVNLKALQNINGQGSSASSQDVEDAKVLAWMDV